MKTDRKLIVDEFTDLNISRQRKWQLRHPKESEVINKRYRHSLNGLVYQREYTRKNKGFLKRRLGAKSYVMERKANEKN